ncbi:aldo-keto reductase Mkms_1984-like isoform X2 [Phymastichus coffea]|nr:aldo-keto reductase Mkms_1984-like isoform X2 [Phymastichus coffea]
MAVSLSSAEQMVKLSSGHNMPVIGLGTWQIKPDDVDRAVSAALEDGYRHIDTATVYKNEEAIGKSLKKWFAKGNKREDLFITTKLPPIGARAADVEKQLRMSLERLALDYVDMYLIHSPTGYLSDDPPVMDFTTDHLAIWKAMEAQVKAGRAKSIGISNFNETQVLNVFDNAEIKPSNLQIELHVYNQQKPLREFCAKRNIAITGYSTLGSPASSAFTAGRALPQLMEHPSILKIAEAHGKSAAQVLLRHSVQSGITVIPKSTNPDRIKANHDIFDFELNEHEMKELSDLDKEEHGRIFNFLVFQGIEKHPQYPWPSQLNGNA